MDEVATWVCIAKFSSNLNSSAYSFNGHSNMHGIFQISEEFCGNSFDCNESCDNYLDDEINDDFACNKKIYAKNKRTYGNGYQTWPVYNIFCDNGRSSLYIKDCEGHFHVPSHHALQHHIGHTQIETYDRLPIIYQTATNYIAKKERVYTKCELAKELRDEHFFPIEDISTWVCIAYHESRLNTSAVGKLNTDGSADHGIFQISDLWWCSPPGNGKGCHTTCDKFEDNDITDDVACVRTIKAEHDRLFGNGFTAWTVYNNHCAGDTTHYISGCGDFSQSKTINPQYNTNTHVSTTYNKSAKKKSKIYTKCELADELLNRHNFPVEEIAIWVCIAYHESRLDTSAVGRLNTDGSVDHGIFQISDLWWCSPPGKEKGCQASCAQFEDSDITDDVECIRTIKAEHDRLFGNGFTAWTVYNPHCSNNVDHYLTGCSLSATHRSTHNPVVYTPQKVQKAKKGKVYDKCELARELHNKHNLPEEEISTWVCIAQHESNLNTAAVGRLNSDGSADHGLFQISDLWWCSPHGNGKGCRKSCDSFEDSDITDDVECIQIIKAEHDRISGNGFTAWTVYNIYCTGNTDHYIHGCFGNDINYIQHPSTHHDTIVPVHQKSTLHFKPNKHLGHSYSVFSKYINKPIVGAGLQTTPSFNIFKSFVNRVTNYAQPSNKFETVEPQPFSIFKSFVDKSTSYTPQESQNSFTVFKNFINTPLKNINQTFTLPFGNKWVDKNLKTTTPNPTETLKYTTLKTTTNSRKYVTISRTTSKPTNLSTTKVSSQANSYKSTSGNIWLKPTPKTNYAIDVKFKENYFPATTKSPSPALNKSYSYSYSPTRLNIDTNNRKIQSLFSPKQQTKPASSTTPRTTKTTTKSPTTTSRKPLVSTYSVSKKDTTQFYSRALSKPVTANSQRIVSTSTTKPTTQSMRYTLTATKTTTSPITTKVLTSGSSRKISSVNEILKTNPKYLTTQSSLEALTSTTIKPFSTKVWTVESNRFSKQNRYLTQKPYQAITTSKKPAKTTSKHSILRDKSKSVNEQTSKLSSPFNVFDVYLKNYKT